MDQVEGEMGPFPAERAVVGRAFLAGAGSEQVTGFRVVNRHPSTQVYDLPMTSMETFGFFFFESQPHE